MSENTGELIDNAYEVMDRTYGEIRNMQNIFTELLQEMQYKFHSYYSRSTNELKIKDSYVFLYIKESSDKETTMQEYFGVVLLFANRGDYPKKTNTKGPEAWFVRLEVSGPLHQMHLRETMSKKNATYFREKPRLGGELSSYHEEGKDVTLDGTWAGYPLTDIKNRESIKSILENLFPADE